MTPDEVSVIVGAVVAIFTAWIAAWQQVHMAQLKKVDNKLSAMNGDVQHVLAEQKVIEARFPHENS